MAPGWALASVYVRLQPAVFQGGFLKKKKTGRKKAKMNLKNVRLEPYVSPWETTIPPLKDEIGKLGKSKVYSRLQT